MFYKIAVWSDQQIEKNVASIILLSERCFRNKKADFILAILSYKSKGVSRNQLCVVCLYFEPVHVHFPCFWILFGPDVFAWIYFTAGLSRGSQDGHFLAQIEE